MTTTATTFETKQLSWDRYKNVENNLTQYRASLDNNMKTIEGVLNRFYDLYSNMNTDNDSKLKQFYESIITNENPQGLPTLREFILTVKQNVAGRLAGFIKKITNTYRTFVELNSDIIIKLTEYSELNSKLTVHTNNNKDQLSELVTLQRNYNRFNSLRNKINDNLLQLNLDVHSWVMFQNNLNRKIIFHPQINQSPIILMQTNSNSTDLNTLKQRALERVRRQFIQEISQQNNQIGTNNNTFNIPLNPLITMSQMNSVGGLLQSLPASSFAIPFAANNNNNPNQNMDIDVGGTPQQTTSQQTNDNFFEGATPRPTGSKQAAVPLSAAQQNNNYNFPQTITTSVQANQSSLTETDNLPPTNSTNSFQEQQNPVGNVTRSFSLNDNSVSFPFNYITPITNRNTSLLPIPNRTTPFSNEEYTTPAVLIDTNEAQQSNVIVPVPSTSSTNDENTVPINETLAEEKTDSINENDDNEIQNEQNTVEYTSHEEEIPRRWARTREIELTEDDPEDGEIIQDESDESVNSVTTEENSNQYENTQDSRSQEESSQDSTPGIVFEDADKINENAKKTRKNNTPNLIIDEDEAVEDRPTNNYVYFQVYRSQNDNANLFGVSQDIAYLPLEYARSYDDVAERLYLGFGDKRKYTVKNEIVQEKTRIFQSNVETNKKYDYTNGTEQINITSIDRKMGNNIKRNTNYELFFGTYANVIDMYKRSEINDIIYITEDSYPIDYNPKQKYNSGKRYSKFHKLSVQTYDEIVYSNEITFQLQPQTHSPKLIDRRYYNNNYTNVTSNTVIAEYYQASPYVMLKSKLYPNTMVAVRTVNDAYTMVTNIITLINKESIRRNSLAITDQAYNRAVVSNKFVIAPVGVYKKYVVFGLIEGENGAIYLPFMATELNLYANFNKYDVLMFEYNQVDIAQPNIRNKTTLASILICTAYYFILNYYILINPRNIQLLSLYDYMDLLLTITNRLGFVDIEPNVELITSMDVGNLFRSYFPDFKSIFENWKFNPYWEDENLSKIIAIMNKNDDEITLDDVYNLMLYGTPNDAKNIIFLRQLARRIHLSMIAIVLRYTMQGYFEILWLYNPVGREKVVIENDPIYERRDIIENYLLLFSTSKTITKKITRNVLISLVGFELDESTKGKWLLDYFSTISSMMRLNDYSFQDYVLQKLPVLTPATRVIYKPQIQNQDRYTFRYGDRYEVQLDAKTKKTYELRNIKDFKDVNTTVEKIIQYRSINRAMIGPKKRSAEPLEVSTILIRKKPKSAEPLAVSTIPIRRKPRIVKNPSTNTTVQPAPSNMTLSTTKEPINETRALLTFNEQISGVLPSNEEENFNESQQIPITDTSMEQLQTVDINEIAIELVSDITTSNDEPDVTTPSFGDNEQSNSIIAMAVTDENQLISTINTDFFDNEYVSVDIDGGKRLKLQVDRDPMTTELGEDQNE